MVAGAIFIGLTACEPVQIGGDTDSGAPAADAGHADAGRADSAAADSQAPDSQAPDSRMPDSRMPDSQTPDSRMPDGQTPDSMTPDSMAPDSATPDSTTPDSLASDVHTADAHADAGAADMGSCVDPLPTADRPVAVECSLCRPMFSDPPGEGECTTHAECTDGINGRCVLGQAGTYCSYDTCFVDDHCASDQLCSCDGDSFSGANRCVPANCRVNADCASGLCAPSYGCLLGGMPVGWYCRTDEDVCTSDEDCTDQVVGRCAYSPSDGHWVCQYGVCVP